MTTPIEPKRLSEEELAAYRKANEPSDCELMAHIAALEQDVQWRKEHMEQSDKELVQLEDWLIGNAEFDPKTGLIDRAEKCKERIRDLVAKEAQLTEALAAIGKKDYVLKEARTQLLERRGLDRDSDNRVAVIINHALATTPTKL